MTNPLINIRIVLAKGRQCLDSLLEYVLIKITACRRHKRERDRAPSLSNSGSFNRPIDNTVYSTAVAIYRL